MEQSVVKASGEKRSRLERSKNILDIENIRNKGEEIRVVRISYRIMIKVVQIRVERLV